jgi:vitamin B12 transporter
MQHKPSLAPLCAAFQVLFLGTLPTLAHAQARPQANPLLDGSMDNIVVTATRTPQPIDASLSKTTVITRADIDAAGPVDLAQLLRIFANADIRATGGAGQPSSVFLRGTNGNHVLFLVDGLRVGSSTIGSTAIETIPVDMIERIEIVKGPASGLYGSDAIGGVIQIFTRGDAKPLLYAKLGVGNENATEASAGFSTVEGNTRLSMSAGHRRIRSQSATNERSTFSFNPDRDPHQLDHVNLKLSQSFRNGETLTISAFQSKARTDFDAGATTNNRNQQKIGGYQLESRNELSPGWQSRLIVGRGTDELRYERGFDGLFKTEQDQVYWTNEFKTPSGFMTAGVDGRIEKVSGSPFILARRETKSVFGGYLERLGAQQIEFSVRRDEEDQYGSRGTGTVAYGLKLSNELQLYAKGGRAFRAPSFSDLYLPPDPDFGPSSNPLLKPERSDSVEAGIKFQSPRFTFSAVGFGQKTEDLIVFIFGSGPQNIPKARIRGVEVEASTQWLGTRIRAMLTRQRPEDEETGKRLQSRAETLASLKLDKSFGQWKVGSALTYTGDRFDSTSEAPTSRMKAFTLIDANVQYAIDKRWSVELAAVNLADKRYELAQGYNAPGRQLMLSVKYLAR